MDRHKAREVWLALRGGWHYHVARTGTISREPVKDDHSHPGDAISYGAAVLFPPGKLLKSPGATLRPQQAGWFKSPATGPLGP